MNEEELKKEIENWSRGCNVNIDFPKGLKYCDGINLCKVCKTNLDLYKAELKGFQKGKQEALNKIDTFMKEKTYCRESGDIMRILPFEWEELKEQLQKEINSHPEEDKVGIANRKDNLAYKKSSGSDKKEIGGEKGK